jgi:hypothetical protein
MRGKELQSPIKQAIELYVKEHDRSFKNSPESKFNRIYLLLKELKET